MTTDWIHQMAAFRRRWTIRHNWIQAKTFQLQILRGLAAVWVVIYHLEFLASQYFQTSLGISFVHAGYLGGPSFLCPERVRHLLDPRGGRRKRKRIRSFFEADNPHLSPC
jgi:hypothetical protein